MISFSATDRGSNVFDQHRQTLRTRLQEHQTEHDRIGQNMVDLERTCRQVSTQEAIHIGSMDRWMRRGMVSATLAGAGGIALIMKYGILAGQMHLPAAIA